jgi:hypothetical protein
VVLRRLTADHDLERHLDSIQLGAGASATPRSSPAPTGSARRWRAVRRRTCPGTSITPASWWTWPARRCRSGHPVSGLRINEGEAHAQEIDLRSR